MSSDSATFPGFGASALVAADWLKRDRHASVPMHFPASRRHQVGTRFGERGGDVAEFRFAIALDDDRMACRDGALRNRQATCSCVIGRPRIARVECEFAQPLGSHGDPCRYRADEGDLWLNSTFPSVSTNSSTPNTPTAFFAGSLGASPAEGLPRRFRCDAAPVRPASTA